MVGYLTAVDMEKQQISPAQVVIRHNRCPTVVVHLIGRARELSLKDLVVGIKNQPATVETFIRPRAPPDIRLAKLLFQAVNRHFGDVMQVVAAEEMIVFRQRLPASVVRLERRRKPFWMLFYLLPIMLAQRPSAFSIAFHNIAGLLFQMGLVLF